MTFGEMFDTVLINAMYFSYLLSSTNTIIVFDPQRTDNFRVQPYHDQHWQSSKQHKPSYTKSLGHPFLGPLLRTKLVFFIEVGRQKERCV